MQNANALCMNVVWCGVESICVRHEVRRWQWYIHIYLYRKSKNQRDKSKQRSKQQQQQSSGKIVNNMKRTEQQQHTTKQNQWQWHGV